jgi:hypothetical protein
MYFTYVTAVSLLALLATAACSQKGRNETSQEAERLKQLKDASLKILPESYRGIWLGISEQEFAKARNGARFQPGRSDPDERKWYKEVDKSGVNVWYGIDRETSSLVVIQFANSIPSWKMFSEHATLLMEKYGTDYELYQCPSGDPKYKMTRLLWAKQPVSIMEAVLEADNAIAVTMLDKEAAMESWLQENLKEEEKTRPKLPGEPGAGCDKDQPDATCGADTKK